jgi:hypothetical protein
MLNNRKKNNNKFTDVSTYSKFLDFMVIENREKLASDSISLDELRAFRDVLQLQGKFNGAEAKAISEKIAVLSNDSKQEKRARKNSDSFTAEMMDEDANDQIPESENDEEEAEEEEEVAEDEEEEEQNNDDSEDEEDDEDEVVDKEEDDDLMLVLKNAIEDDEVADTEEDADEET